METRSDTIRQANSAQSEEWRPALNPLPFWKRALDIGCIFILTPVLFPIMTFVAVGILLSSPGGVIFRQERIGLRGKPFTLLKFRTMENGSGATDHQEYSVALIHSGMPMEKMDANDKRVFKFGAFLRASGLDELPQLLNVLRREMSLVGPRPCIRYEYEQYLPKHRLRHNALPGLTGLWQVSGKNRTTFEEMIELDLRYSNTRSLGQDIAILFCTIPVAIHQVHKTWRRKQFALLKRLGDTEPLDSSPPEHQSSNCD
jgi:lipopolysaccharide/colanic/teichoic acid biosynthesis glycosyltransferase